MAMLVTVLSCLMEELDLEGEGWFMFPGTEETSLITVVTPANARICSTLTLHVCCLLRHVSTCVHMAYSYTSA